MSVLPFEGPDRSPERILALEEQVAHQARVIDELSAELRRQGELVDRLVGELYRQRERLGELAEGVGPHEITRPPHY